eukprot:749351-Hanusia_phi.AAC.9
MRADPYTLHVALNVKSEAAGSLYMDDGDSDEHAAGGFLLFSLKFQSGRLEFRKTEGSGFSLPHAPPSLERVIVYGMTRQPARVTLKRNDGSESDLEFIFDKESAVRRGAGRRRRWREKRAGELTILASPPSSSRLREHPRDRVHSSGRVGEQPEGEGGEGATEELERDSVSRLVPRHLEEDKVHVRPRDSPAVQHVEVPQRRRQPGGRQAPHPLPLSVAHPRRELEGLDDVTAGGGEELVERRVLPVVEDLEVSQTLPLPLPRLQMRLPPPLPPLQHLLLRHRRPAPSSSSSSSSWLLVDRLDHVQRFLHEAALDISVHLLVHVEARPVVGLQQPWPQLVVKQHVHPDDLKRHARPGVVGDGAVVLEPQVRQLGQHRPPAQLSDPLPGLGRVVAHRPHLLPHDGQRALAPLLLVVADEAVGVVLVERVVGQVHHRLLQVLLARRHVLLRAEPREPHVEPHVELEPVEEQRLVHVPLHDVAVAAKQLVLVACPHEEDSGSLRAPVRLHDEGLGLLLPQLLIQTLPVLRQDPRHGEEEEVLLRRRRLHAVEQAVERALVADLLHPRQEVHPLLPACPAQQFGAAAVRGVEPEEASVGLALHLPPAHAGDDMADQLEGGVVAVAQEDAELLGERPRPPLPPPPPPRRRLCLSIALPRRRHLLLRLCRYAARGSAGSVAGRAEGARGGGVQQGRQLVVRWRGREEEVGDFPVSRPVRLDPVGMRRVHGGGAVRLEGRRGMLPCTHKHVPPAAPLLRRPRRGRAFLQLVPQGGGGGGGGGW